MTAPATDPTMVAINSERNAETFLALLKTGYASPDALLAQIEAARLRSPDALRAYVRRVQKELEARHGNR